MKRSKGLVGQPLLYAVSCFASLGVFLFGFDQGVMSGIITGPYFKAFFNNPTRYEVGTMVAILEIGAFMTSLAAGRIGDIFGRRRTLFWGAIIFSVGGAIQTFATSFQTMVFGRIVSGFGVGFLSMIVPVYQSEISEADNRGKLACIEFTGNIVGYASSVWIDYFASFIESNASWRVPLGVQVVIGTILAVGSLVIPESPRWLLDTDQDAEGMKVIADLYGGGDPNNKHARREFREIKEAVLIDRAKGNTGYVSMFRQYTYRVFIAMSAQAFAQLNGINVISYYAPLVFEQAGWIGRDAILMTGINAIVYILSTIPPWYVVDKWGRRFILLSGALVMAVFLMLIGYWMYLDTTITPSAVVICVVAYNAAFGFSWGPIPWLYPPEIMPLSVRVKGVSLSTATNWAFNWVVGEATPILQERIKWRLYPLHGFFCCLSFIVVYFFFPETKGIPLEEMDDIFKDAGSQDDVEERAPLRSGNSGIDRSLTEPPRLSDEDYRNSPTLMNKVFGGRPSPPQAAGVQRNNSTSNKRTPSNERNYRSTDQ